MKQTTINYAAALYELSVPEETVQEAQAVLARTPQLKQVLQSPVTSLKEKHAVIDRIFPAGMRSFLKELCDNRDTDVLDQLFEAYGDYSDRAKHILHAELRCTFQPSPEQLARFEDYIRKTYGCSGIRWNIIPDPSLIDGFLLRVGDRESDWSLKGRLKQLQQKLMWR